MTIEVHRPHRAAGQGRVQWLAAHGFTWKETGYIEPDMCFREAEIPPNP